jgi:hypothetical protein
MAAAWDQAAGHRRFALKVGKLGQQGSNLKVLLNNVLNILTVNLAPKAHRVKRSSEQKALDA